MAQGESPTAGQQVFPVAEWGQADPQALGFDSERLDQLATDAAEYGTRCLLVTRHGRIATEWYWHGADERSPQEVSSITKSVVSSLVGMAQSDGCLDLDDSASDYIDAWRDTPAAAVTVRNLLSQDSGRYWPSFDADVEGVLMAPDRTGYAIGISQEQPPGRVWRYNQTAIQALDAVLTTATGRKTRIYARERLLDPIGMSQSELSVDAQGNATMSLGLQSTCRDTARFGYLFLRRGNWNGRQILPETWVDAATETRARQSLNASWGVLRWINAYMWWPNRRGPLTDDEITTDALDLDSKYAALAPDVSESTNEFMVPGAPETMYWSFGLGSQILQVDPTSDTVVVRFGLVDPTSARYGPADTAKLVTEALLE
jgi:CubicO group peptidase (beta-lactamase class C family)